MLKKQNIRTYLFPHFPPFLFLNVFDVIFFSYADIKKFV